MQRQTRTTPRKRPRHARRKATVDSILEATTRVLVKQGFDPDGIPDPLYFNDMSARVFVPLDRVLYEKIQSGHARV